MKKVALLIVVMFSCTDSERTVEVLRKAGYKNIETTGHSYSCSDSDTYCTGFTAIGPSGQLVEGAVGCGSSTSCSKGCTIRIN